jgi:phage terminase large subunit
VSTAAATRIRKLTAEVGELLERHERGSSAETFAKYHDDPCGFLTEVLGVKNLWSRQRDIALAVRDRRQVAVRSNNSAGKDYLAARLALWWAVCRGGLVILTGPTERQVRQVLWKELARAFRSNADLPGELFSLAYRIGDEDKILGFTSDNADRLTGFHDANMLIVVTEGQGVEADAYEAAQACATSENSRICVLGNPLRNTGEFYRISKSPNWHDIRISAHEHPNVIEGREVIPGAVTAEWIANIEAEYGKDSAQYKARVDGEFPESGSIDSLVESAWIARAVELWESQSLHVTANAFPRIVVADIARGGADHTCIGIMRGPVLESLDMVREPDLMQTAKMLHEWALEIGRLSTGRVRPTAEDLHAARAHIVVDDAGLGGGVTDRLRELKARVHPFIGAAAAKRNPGRFANARAEAYFAVREALMKERLALPPIAELREELLATDYTTNAADKIIIENKDLIRAKIGRSPDRADVLSMGCAVRVTGAATIARGVHPIRIKSGVVFG